LGKRDEVKATLKEESMKAIIGLSVIVLLAFGGSAVALAAVDSSSAAEACDCGCGKAKAKEDSKAKKSFATPPKVGTEAVSTPIRRNTPSSYAIS
jgi:hypothetical protein